MGLIDRINAARATQPGPSRRDAALGLGQWAQYFQFGGLDYPIVQTTMGNIDEEAVALTATAAAKSNGPIFSLVLARQQIFSQARFQWTRFQAGAPTDLFGSSELGVLERPWPGGTTGDLLGRMEWNVSTAGNAYVRRTAADRLNVLHPHWVIIVLGSQTDAEHPAEAPDVEVAGHVYDPPSGRMQFYPADGSNGRIAHFAPIPDPDFHFLGMSWITPVLRELQADGMATEHKYRFFQNAATPNLAIKYDPSVSLEQVKAFKALMEEEHTGVANAYRTLYMGGGADPKVIGADMRQLDFAATQGKGESRLAAAAGVPPSWVGFSEGLQGSALNAGNFSSARRRLSDGTLEHLWSNAAASLEVLLTPPDSGSSLWYTTRSVAFMREDAEVLARIQQTQAQTITALVRDGFTAKSATAAVMNNDMSLLVHTGLTSVQLQPPTDGQEPISGENSGQAPPAAGAAPGQTPAEGAGQ
ncbi:phage portal protein [Streptomyces sp. NPDC020983]|uniref:phage portal protein n=1 Tax=Streptomyces sp. NPDC020983 TaxID=3365106 RepID=UPI00378D46E2